MAMPAIPSISAGGGGPSGASSGNSMFDSSGFNVNFGSGGVTSSATAAGSDLMAYIPYALAALVASAWFKSNRKA